MAGCKTLAGGLPPSLRCKTLAGDLPPSLGCKTVAADLPPSLAWEHRRLVALVQRYKLGTDVRTGTSLAAWLHGPQPKSQTTAGGSMRGCAEATGDGGWESPVAAQGALGGGHQPEARVGGRARRVGAQTPLGVNPGDVARGEVGGGLHPEGGNRETRETGARTGAGHKWAEARQQRTVIKGRRWKGSKRDKGGGRR